MSSVDRGSGFGSFLGIFVAGAAAGATIALLTTSRNGRENRARLKDAARSVGETLQEIPGSVQKAGAKALKTGQAVFAQAKEDAAQAYTKATEARPASMEHKGYGVDKELPRFAK